MRIYVAGADQGPEREEALGRLGLIRWRLCSYADRPEALETFMRWASSPGRGLFMDSGAFSVRSRGAEIDLGEYCEFVREHSVRIDCYANLDVIGDWRASASNLDRMLSAGLQPVPVFHQGSPMSELDRLAREHRHIALGGVTPSAARGLAATPEKVQPHLDACFAIIAKHWPVRVHMFGLTQQWLLERYPFWSSDSTSAIRGGGMGVVLHEHGGRFVWRGWREHVRETLDGSVCDGISASRRPNGSALDGRIDWNLLQQRRMEEHVTRVWRARGVAWA